jgi:ribosomal protein L24E
MPECEYTGEEIPETGGKLLVKTTGERLYFKSGKEQKDWEKGRSHEYKDK